jgi:hypothetical protein
MKQTAVEWLYERFLSAGYAVNSEWKKQAKEMEKEQIIDAHIDGQSLVSCKDEYAEQYYNETFNKEK